MVSHHLVCDFHEKGEGSGERKEMIERPGSKSTAGSMPLY